MPKKDKGCCIEPIEGYKPCCKRDGPKLEEVHNFQYFERWINNTEAGLKVRKAIYWKACNDLPKICKSALPRSIKTSLFTLIAESILLYSHDAWTLSK